MQSFINSLETKTDTLLEKLREFVPKKRHTELESLMLEFKNTLSEEAKSVKVIKEMKEKKEKKEKIVTEKKAKKEKNPNSPKKPLSSYFLFVKKMTATVKDKNPEIQPKDVAKTLGGMWKAMSDDEKLPYTQQAAADRELYKKEASVVNTSDVNSNSDDKNDENESGKKSTGKKVKKEKDPNVPKRPLSAYILFCNAKRSEIRSAHPDMDAKDVTREMGKMWRELSEQEQSKWKNQ
jgi:hypothetical protein